MSAAECNTARLRAETERMAAGVFHAEPLCAEHGPDVLKDVARQIESWWRQALSQPWFKPAAIIGSIALFVGALWWHSSNEAERRADAQRDCLTAATEHMSSFALPSERERMLILSPELMRRFEACMKLRGLSLR
jgi:hypothetical protein